MQYAVVFTGLVAAASAFKFPQLEKRQANGVTTVPSTTVVVTVTYCPSASSVLSTPAGRVTSGRATRTVTRTHCPTTRRARATGASATGAFPVYPNATAYYPSLSYASAYFPVATGSSVTLQQQINNYLSIKNNLSLSQQQAQFQQLTASFQGVTSLTQSQASFFASESQQLFGAVQTVAPGADVTAAPGQVYVSAGTTFASGAQPTPLPPIQSQSPGIASFKGAATKATTGSAFFAAIAAIFAL